MRILLDTDIGDDIDDALAIALALRHPDVELIGVTTVFRDTTLRARMTRYLLDVYGHSNIPVYAGAGKPLLRPMPREPHEPQLDLTPAEVADSASMHAVDIIRNTYSQPDSDVTLVTIGPLTNLALALAIEPALAQRIPRVVAMGGWIGRAESEWNIKCDAEAAAIVLNAGLPLTLVPIDVTRKTQMQPNHLQMLQAATDEPTRWLMRLTDVWQKKTLHLPTLHDPLALAVAIDPRFVATQSLALGVVTTPGPGYGITCIVNNAGAAVDVALEVDGARFMDWYVEQILAA